MPRDLLEGLEEVRQPRDLLEGLEPIEGKKKPKTFWGALGAEITPQMEQQAPYLTAIAKTGQEISTAPAHYINQLLLNYPRFLLEKKDIEYPEAETLGGKILSKGAGVAGIVTNPLLRAIGALTGAGKVIAPATKLGTRIGRGALGGAVTGGVYAQPMEQRPYTAGLGAFLGGLFGAGVGGVKRIQSIKKWGKTDKITGLPKEQIKLANESQSALLTKKANLIQEYGEGYNRIVNQIDDNILLNEPVKNLIENSEEVLSSLQYELGRYPQGQKIANMVGKVHQFSDEPISIKEADKLVKFIKNLPSIGNKLQRAYKVGFGQVDFINEERILLEFAGDIQDQILRKAPDLAGLKQNYGQVMTDIKRVRPFIRWGQAIKNFKNFNNLDPQVKETFLRIMPQNTMNKIVDFNQANNIVNLLKRFGIETLKYGSIATGLGLGGRIIGETLRRE